MSCLLFLPLWRTRVCFVRNYANFYTLLMWAAFRVFQHVESGNKFSVTTHFEQRSVDSAIPHLLDIHPQRPSINNNTVVNFSIFITFILSLPSFIPASWPPQPPAMPSPPQQLFVYPQPKSTTFISPTF